jgi:hypothetical protein
MQESASVSFSLANDCLLFCDAWRPREVAVDSTVVFLHLRSGQPYAPSFPRRGASRRCHKHTVVCTGASYSFRTLPKFETSTERYAFLNRIITVGIGETRRQSGAPDRRDIVTTNVPAAMRSCGGTSQRIARLHRFAFLTTEPRNGCRSNGTNPMSKRANATSDIGAWTLAPMTRRAGN